MATSAFALFATWRWSQHGPFATATALTKGFDAADRREAKTLIEDLS